MSEQHSLPAYSRDSGVLRLSGVETLDDLSPDWAWGGSRGEGARVAVIDSGIEADHPDLDGCVDVDHGVRCYVASDGSVAEEHGPHDDSFGHGTACADIIHAIAPAARITSVKVLGAGLSGKAAAFLRGLTWSIEQGFDVINLSLGTTRKEWALPFYEVCDRAYFEGTFLVTAANNVLRPSYPSLFGAVASVACNLSRDPLRFHYNPEPPTEFLAPGVEVDVAWKGGSRVTSTGNSYAAPHLAGVAALIKAKHPELRPFQLKTVLWATAANVREAPQQAGRISRATRVSAALRSTRATSAFRSATGGESADTAAPEPDDGRSTQSLRWPG